MIRLSAAEYDELVAFLDCQVYPYMTKHFDAHQRWSDPPVWERPAFPLLYGHQVWREVECPIERGTVRIWRQGGSGDWVVAEWFDHGGTRVLHVGTSERAAREVYEANV